MSLESVWLIVGGIASLFAIVGGSYSFFVIIKRWLRSQPFRKPIPITSLEAQKIFDALAARRGRVIRIDTVLDFSRIVGDSENIWRQFDLDQLFDGDSLRNGVCIPIASKKLSSSPANPVPLNSLRIVVNDPDRLRVSHGGTGIIQVLLSGNFEVETRAFSGPSVEITLREVS